MEPKFDCKQCKPLEFDLKKFLREFFCIHHYVLLRTSYVRHACHKCGKPFISLD